jgi:large subunit ribosomal protein L35
VPKMKTHSGAKKRFKLTANGKVKRKSANKNHINAKMKPERKRRLGKSHYVSEVDEPRIKRLLIAG